MKSSERQNIQRFSHNTWLVPYNEKIEVTPEGETVYEYDEVIVEASDAKEALTKSMLKRIDEHDKSSDVNSFFLNGHPMWLPLEERKSMRQSLIALKAEGIETFTYWLGLTPITMPVAKFEGILNAVEVYALKCFNVTVQHKGNIMPITTLEEMDAYDITAGYPEKLSF